MIRAKTVIFSRSKFIPTRNFNDRFKIKRTISDAKFIFNRGLDVKSAKIRNRDSLEPSEYLPPSSCKQSISNQCSSFCRSSLPVIPYPFLRDTKKGNTFDNYLSIYSLLFDFSRGNGVSSLIKYL